MLGTGTEASRPLSVSAGLRFIAPVLALADASGLFSAFLANAALPRLSDPGCVPELL